MSGKIGTSGATDGGVINSDRWSGVFLLLLAVVGAWNANGFSYLGGVFVRWALGIVAVLGSALFVKGFVRPDRRTIVADRRDLPAVLLLLASLAAYVALLPLLGFIVSSSLFAGPLAIALLGDRRSPRLSTLASAIGALVSVGLYAVFHYGFAVPLPVGSLWTLL